MGGLDVASLAEDVRALRARLDTLAACSESAERLERRSYTPAMAAANAHVASWMRDAGMTVRQDAAGNLSGRYEAAVPGARTLLLGSHLDTVRDAGKYDGPLGVLVALACVERLRRAGLPRGSPEGSRLPFTVEVMAFADEEGLRFGSAYLGSAAAAGTFDPRWLELADGDGITLAEALRAFGGDPAGVAACRRRPEELLGYCEVHIEQGPVLEALDLPAGVVTAIAGQSRATVTFSGAAGHAGTVPMEARHDALCAAAEFVLATERAARARRGAVATVGQIVAQPGASNVIPGQVTVSLDARHADDGVRGELCDLLHAKAEEIGAARGVAASWQIAQQSDAVTCSPGLSGTLAEAIAALGHRVHRLTSGAGHDAVAMARVTPVAMLFVRCRGGVSHHPAEFAAEEDIGVAIDVLEEFLRRVDG
jgi:allantoate deiminase